MDRKQLEAEVRKYSQAIRRLGKQGDTEMKPRIVRQNISTESLEQRLKELKDEVARVVASHKVNKDTFKQKKGDDAKERVSAALDASSKSEHDKLQKLLNKIKYAEPDEREELYNQLWDYTDAVIYGVINDEDDEESEGENNNVHIF